MLCGQTLQASRSICRHLNTATESMMVASMSLNPACILAKYWFEWYLVDYPTLFRTNATQK